MSESEEILNEQVSEVIQLGDSWFGHTDDISREDLGAFRKKYVYRLGYNDVFEVKTYEHGAECYFSGTGVRKLFKDIQTAFSVAKQMKARTKMLYHLFRSE